MASSAKFVPRERAGHDRVKTRLVELRAEQELFYLKLAFTSYYTRCMSGRRLRSGKIVGKHKKKREREKLAREKKKRQRRKSQP